MPEIQEEAETASKVVKTNITKSELDMASASNKSFELSTDNLVFLFL